MYVFALKSGKEFSCSDLNSITGTIWVELIDWDKTDRKQFKDDIPAWVNEKLGQKKFKFTYKA
jgi:hypothetical protein